MVNDNLLAAGWRSLTVWECALKGLGRLTVEAVIARCAEWLRSVRQNEEIRGTKCAQSEEE